MILSFNFYYANPGLAEAVLRQRLRACEVRQDLGLPRGRVFSREVGDDALPDVIWELGFAAMEGHFRDMDARAASAEFEAVRAGMRKLCRRFERPLFEVVNMDAGAARASGEAAFVVLEWVYCRPQASAAICAALQAQAAGAEQPMLASTLARLITPGDDLPQLVFKREYPRDWAPTSLPVDILSEGTTTDPERLSQPSYRRASSVWKVL